MAKIKDLFSLVKGTLQSSKCTPGEYNFITASKEWKTHNEYEYDCEALIFAAAASGSLGRTHYVNGKFISSDLCFIITPKDKKKYPIDLKFYHIIFNTLKEDIVKSTKAGTSKEAIGLKSLGDYELPYISIEEQKEISAKFNNATIISEQFSSETTHQLDTIKDLRQAFLREAMQGKLVRNETTDGATGANLLTEIQVEKAQLIKEKKIKKSKSLAPISEDEIPFEIPDNWTWCRLGEFGDLKRGKSKHRPRNDVRLFENGTIPFIQTGDVARSKNNKDIIETINGYYNEFGLAQSELQPKGTLCITIAANIAESGFLGFDACLPDSIVCFDTNKDFSKRFVHYFVRLSKVEIERFAPATAQKNINLEILNDLYFPLPPLEIQERIVAKLDELMAVCDALETQVRQSHHINEQLLQQVLREALEGNTKEEKQVEEVLLQVAEDPSTYSILPIKPKVCDQNDIAILAGHIIQELNTNDFGRVKLQKMLHLTEYHCQLETDLNYQKKVAGPHTEQLKSNIEPLLKRHRFFDIKMEKLGKNDKVTYTALSASSQISKCYKTEFQHQVDSIDFVLNKFKDKKWEFCEMISTMYAVWNNRLIKNQPITNEDLKSDFLAWDKEKVKFIDQLDYAITWIKKENIIPTGFGKFIDKK